MPSKIPAGLSLYLDLVRFVAAVSVLLYHTWDTLMPGMPFKWPAHEAVVVFFVLSGYVISHATHRPGMTLRVYLQHRAARILPVAVCALLLGVLVAVLLGSAGGIGAGTAPSFGETTPGPVSSPAFWWATLANLLFIAQAGGFFVSPPFNTPFWSLNYEVWYYAIFACWLFTPARWRLAATVLAALLAGPKILLLFPVWLYGVWLHRHMPRLSVRRAQVLFVLTLVAAAALTWLDASDALRSWLYRVFPPAWHAHFSTQFLYDLILGLVVSVNFAAVAAIGDGFRWMFALQRPIRYLATFTFSLYVFHMPLAVLARDGLGLQAAAGFYGFIVLGVFLLAQVTERRTAVYRRVFAPALVKAA